MRLLQRHSRSRRLGSAAQTDARAEPVRPEDGADERRRRPADLMLLATVTIWSLNFTVTKYVLNHGFRPLAYGGIRFSAPAVLFAGVTYQLAAQDYYGSLPGLVWLAFAFAVVGPLFVTNLLWFNAIHRVGPSRAAIYTNLQPFLGAVFALVILSESMTGLQVAGGLLIATGITLSARREPAMIAEPTRAR